MYDGNIQANLIEIEPLSLFCNKQKSLGKTKKPLENQRIMATIEILRRENRAGRYTGLDRLLFDLRHKHLISKADFNEHYNEMWWRDIP